MKRSTIYYTFINIPNQRFFIILSVVIYVQSMCEDVGRYFRTKQRVVNCDIDNLRNNVIITIKNMKYLTITIF